MIRFCCSFESTLIRGKVFAIPLLYSRFVMDSQREENLEDVDIVKDTQFSQNDYNDPRVHQGKEVNELYHLFIVIYTIMKVQIQSIESLDHCNNVLCVVFVRSVLYMDHHSKHRIVMFRYFQSNSYKRKSLLV